MGPGFQTHYRAVWEGWVPGHTRRVKLPEGVGIFLPKGGRHHFWRFTTILQGRPEKMTERSLGWSLLVKRSPKRLHIWRWSSNVNFRIPAGAGRLRGGGI